MSALQGKRILVTRSKGQAGALAQQLEAKGATPVLLPIIEIAEPEDCEPLDEALRQMESFGWIVFTSANAVQAVAERLAFLGLSGPTQAKIAVVGSATAEALQSQLQRDPDAMPDEYVSSAIAAEMGELDGVTVLLPRGNLAGPELPAELGSRGALVTEVIAYRTVRSAEANDLGLDTKIDAITLTSGEAARAVVERLKANGLEPWLQTVPLICIGPVTAEALKAAGYEPAVVAEDHTIPGLVEAAERFYGQRKIYAAKH